LIFKKTNNSGVDLCSICRQTLSNLREDKVCPGCGLWPRYSLLWELLHEEANRPSHRELEILEVGGHPAFPQHAKRAFNYQNADLNKDPHVDIQIQDHHIFCNSDRMMWEYCHMFFA